MSRLSKRTKQSIISVLIVLVVAVVTVLIFHLINQQENDHPTSSATPSSTSSNQTSSKQSSDSPSPDTPPDYESEKEHNKYKSPTADDSGDLTGILSYAALSGDTATLTFIIDQYLTSGTCSLDFNGTTATATPETSAATSSCSFRFPASGLVEGERYTYTMRIASGDQSGVISGEANF